MASLVWWCGTDQPWMRAWQGGLLPEPDGTPIEGEERPTREAWSTSLWTAMSVRRLARLRETDTAEEKGSMSSPPPPLSVSLGAAVEDEGLESLRARFLGVCMLQAGEASDPPLPLFAGDLRAARRESLCATRDESDDSSHHLPRRLLHVEACDGASACSVVVSEQQTVAAAETEARCDGSGSVRRRGAVSSWYTLTRKPAALAVP